MHYLRAILPLLALAGCFSAAEHSPTFPTDPVLLQESAQSVYGISQLEQALTTRTLDDPTGFVDSVLTDGLQQILAKALVLSDGKQTFPAIAIYTCLEFNTGITARLLPPIPGYDRCDNGQVADDTLHFLGNERDDDAVRSRTPTSPSSELRPVLSPDHSFPSLRFRLVRLTPDGFHVEPLELTENGRVELLPNDRPQVLYALAKGIHDSLWKKYVWILPPKYGSSVP